MVKILVIVEGGVLQYIRCSETNPNVVVSVLDWDDVKAGGTWLNLSEENAIDKEVETIFPYVI